MFNSEYSRIAARKVLRERRRPFQSNPLKTAKLHPILEEERLEISDIWLNGVSANCTLTPGLHDDVYLSFDGKNYVAAEVLRKSGCETGFTLKQRGLAFCDIFDDTGFPLLPPHACGAWSQSGFLASVAIVAPAVSGVVMDASKDGIMIEISNIAKGTRFLVQTSEEIARRGEAGWTAGGMTAIFF